MSSPLPDGSGSLNGRKLLYSICALIYLNSTMAGLDASLIGNIYALSEFKRSFQLDDSIGSSSIVGLIFSSMQIGGIMGAFFLWIADVKGRTYCIRLGSMGVIMGAIIQGGATTVPRLIFGRFFLGFFSTLACRSSSIYLVELAAPNERGKVAGGYNTLFFFGSLLATLSVLICQTRYAGTELSWRIPILCQMICPAIVATGVNFVPESPRWLFTSGQSEQARQVLMRLRESDEKNTTVEKELMQMSEDLRASQTTKFTTWQTILRKDSGRRHRLLILICMSVFGQASGNNVISYYLPRMVAGIGITDISTKLIMNALYALVGWWASAGGAYLHDIYGRRKMLLGSTIGLSACMLILTTSASYYKIHPTLLASSMSIASIYIFGLVFATGYTSMQPVYPAEVMTNDMRAKGMAIATIAGGSAGFLNNLIAPTAMAKFGHLFYLFYVVWDLFEAVIINKYFVETRGFGLEDMESIFQSTDPVYESLARQSVGSTAKFE